MDPRSNKPYDFVAVTKNLTEGLRKTRLIQMNWFQKYEWLLDEHVKLEEEIKKLCEEKRSADTTDVLKKDDKRSCLPAPITTSSEYGWLAQKPEFRLEKYGSYVPEYPDPLRDVTPLSGNMPVLAAGKGYFY